MYDDFVKEKLRHAAPVGFQGNIEGYGLKPHQLDLTGWALKRGRDAIFADTGLGKSRMQIAWADQVHKHTGNPVIILAPLAVAEQTVEEGQKIGVTVTHAREQYHLTSGINITNYDRIHKFDLSGFGGVVLDECFPPDTLIDLEFGRKAIKDIHIGDKIKNASGIDIVADIHRRKVSHGIKIKFKGHSFISSPNHPIFTQRGWIGAQYLRPGDYALETRKALSMVRGDICSKTSFVERSEILRDILLSEMADEPSRAQGQGSYSGNVQEDSCGLQEMDQLRCSGSNIGKGENSQPKSNEGRGSEKESIPHIESHEAQTFRAWGKRSWFDSATKDLDGCSMWELESGICFVVGKTDSRLSNELQNRLSKSRFEDSNRSGWQLTLQQETNGSEEGSEVGFIRVEGIEVLERGHNELEKYRDADGELYFYDLGATRHPSFSVNGVLVHNSSVIKHSSSKTLQKLLETFAHTPYKLCATATPAPNDWTELGTHAEFLGIRSNTEMLSEFFIHDAADTGEWRLKKHARKEFWKWVCSWGIMIRSPADLGHDASEYNLPELIVEQHTVDSEQKPLDGMLFALEANTLSERRESRKASLNNRVKACADLVNNDIQPWIVWCDYNAEADALKAAIPDAVEIRGPDDAEVKEQRLHDFAHGKIRVLISKTSITGFGLNWQHCCRQAFVGITDSFESYYQAVRRSWRFGQTKPVHVHVFASQLEGAVVANLKAKEIAAREMSEFLSKETLESVRAEIYGSRRESNPYNAASSIIVPSFLKA